MKILELKEHEDGSATAQVEMTNEEKEMLLQFALVELLKRHIKEVGAEPQKDYDENDFASGTTRSHVIED